MNLFCGLRSCSWMLLLLIASTSVMSADEPAKPAPFVLNPKLIEQARRAAAAEMAKPRDLKARRPKGLEHLETPEDIARAVDEAMASLEAKDFPERYAGEHRLKYLGEHAFEALVSGLKSDREELSFHCARLLGSQGKKAIIPLVDQLSRPSERVANASVQSLVELGDLECLPAVIKYVESNQSRVTGNILYFLCNVRDPRVVEPLLRIRSKTPKVGYVTISPTCIALRKYPPPSWEYSYWPQEKLAIRQLCLDASGLAGERYGQPEVDLIINELGPLRSQIVMRDTAGALKSLRFPAAIPAVIKVIQQCDDLCEKNRRQASPNSSPILHLESSVARERRRELCQILARIPVPEAVDLLINDLLSPDHDERAISIEAQRWSVPLLVGLLDDEALLRGKLPIRYELADGKVEIAIPSELVSYDRLNSMLARFGLEGRQRRISIEKDPRRNPIRFMGDADDIRAEFTRVKQWWDRHGEDFLAGNNVPNPQLSIFDIFKDPLIAK